MRGQLRNLRIDELVVHDVPQKLSRRLLVHDLGENEMELPVYSQVPSPVNSEIITFFLYKITSTIGSKNSFDVAVDPDCSSPVPRLVQEYLNADIEERIPITQEIAAFLYEKQTARNSAGLLLFVRCLIDEDVVLAILKVEREEGVRVLRAEDAGLVTFDIEHIRDLMLTEKTKLFKIALFWIEHGSISGIVCDQQRGSSVKEVAEFFLADFLGCMLREAPEIVTKRFFEVTEKYLNECINSAEDKAALLNHITSELTSQSPMINPTEFARKYLPIERRDQFVQFVEEHATITSSFRKDISLIENRLRKVYYGFASGITVTGTRDALVEKTIVRDTDGGLTRLEILDELKKVVSR